MAIKFVIFLALASTISTTNAGVPLSSIIIAPVASSYSAHTVHHAVATPVAAAPLIQAPLVPAIAPIPQALFNPAPITQNAFIPASIAQNTFIPAPIGLPATFSAAQLAPASFFASPINAPRPVVQAAPQLFTPNNLVPISAPIAVQPGQLFTIPSSNQATQSQKGNRKLRPAKLQARGRKQKRINSAKIVAAPNGRFINSQSPVVPVRTTFIPAQTKLVPVSGSLVSVPARFMRPPASVIRTPFVAFSAPLIAKARLYPVPSPFMVPPPLNQKLILG